MEPTRQVRHRDPLAKVVARWARLGSGEPEQRRLAPSFGTKISHTKPKAVEVELGPRRPRDPPPPSSE
jgi:hypothetical protein